VVGTGIDEERLRHRQGPVRMRDGIPYSNSATTLSLLPGAAMGRWMAAQQHHVRGRLLDAGCGNQPFRDWYAPLAEEVICLDAAPLPGVDVVGLADRLPFADASFDTLLVTEVLEHVGDAEVAVAEIHRVLRPGGHALITVPYLYPTHEAPYDFRRFTHFGLSAILKRHGLEVVTLDAKGGGVLLLAHLFVLALVAGLDAVSSKLDSPNLLTDNRALRRLLATPQESAGRRLRAASGVRGSATRASLGYMAVARRPGSPAPSAAP